MHYADYKSILSPKNGFNLYRGCAHGCIYCDSRSDCYQMDHEFEDIEVKRDAIRILEEQLARRRNPCMVSTGAMCDPYTPPEDSLGLTRQALERILKYGFGISLLTKSALVLRDLDLLSQLHAKTKCVVQMTLTTYDEKLCRMLEPNVSTTAERVYVLKRLREAGIPTVVWLGPILPFINDSEENLRGLLKYCREASVHGVLSFGFGMTLRKGNREYYYRALDRLFPGLKSRYIRHFGNSYECPSPNHRNLSKLFHRECEAMGILHRSKEIFGYLNEMETGMEQLTLDSLLFCQPDAGERD